MHDSNDENTQVNSQIDRKLSYSDFTQMKQVMFEQNQQNHQQLERKHGEPFLQQLQEQLQLNLLKQTYPLQNGDGRKSLENLPDLQLQQQQLLAQFQFFQQQILNENPLERKPSLSSSEREISVSSPCPSPCQDSRSPSPFPSSLYQHGLCGWTGCEAVCDDKQSFRSHMSSQHILDDKSTAQIRIQIHNVNQLELQLVKERQRLEAMMTHLYPAKEAKMSTNPSPIPSNPPQNHQSDSKHHLEVDQSHTIGPIRQRHQERNSPQVYEDSLPRAPKLERRTSHLDDPDEEINKSRMFYRANGVRPPFTYAALIRQAIKESRDGQLTLNEIYLWFQHNFVYFKQNAATWKNAVRHNLSLHKCFMRVENVKGAVWTVDEREYHSRRPQRVQRVQGGQQSFQSNSPTLVQGSYSLQSNSPTQVEGSSFYGEFLNSRDREIRSPRGESPPRMDEPIERSFQSVDLRYNYSPLVKIEGIKEEEKNMNENNLSRRDNLAFNSGTRMTPPLSPGDCDRQAIRFQHSQVSSGFSEGPQDLSVNKS